MELPSALKKSPTDPAWTGDGARSAAVVTRIRTFFRALVIGRSVLQVATVFNTLRKNAEGTGAVTFDYSGGSQRPTLQIS